MYLDCPNAGPSGLGFLKTEPWAGPAAPSTPAWWEAPLGQATQAVADWVSSETSGIPTYGGAPAYPVQIAGGLAYQVQGGPPLPMEPARNYTVPALALGAAALLAAKLAGVF